MPGYSSGGSSTRETVSQSARLPSHLITAGAVPRPPPLRPDSGQQQHRGKQQPQHAARRAPLRSSWEPQGRSLPTRPPSFAHMSSIPLLEAFGADKRFLCRCSCLEGPGAAGVCGSGGGGLLFVRSTTNDVRRQRSKHTPAAANRIAWLVNRCTPSKCNRQVGGE